MESIQISDEVLKYENVINNVLKEELKKLHEQWEVKSLEMAEWIQLKEFLQCVKEKNIKCFKTKLDIGGNILAHAVVPNTEQVLINIGAGIWIDLGIDEAIPVVETRIKISQKQLNIIDEASFDVRATIRTILCGLQELQKIK